MGLIRFLLASAVVFTHTGFVLPLTGGIVSVQAFFIISGFYMALILSEKYNTCGSYKTFYVNRMLRIFPSYYLVMLAYVPLIGGLYLRHHDLGPLNPYLEHPEVLRPESVLFFIVTNLAIVGQDLVMFLKFDPIDHALRFTTDFGLSNPRVAQFLLIVPTWSLGTELMFYLLAPRLVKSKIVNLTGLIIVSLLLRYFITVKLGLDGNQWIYKFFPTELALFLFGVLSYKLAPYIRSVNFYRCVPPTIFAIAVIWIVSFPTVGISKWAFYAFLALGMPLIFDLTKKSRLDRSIGDLSYVIYISHMLVSWVVERNRFSGIISQQYSGLAILAATVVFSIGVIRLTKPIEDYRQRRAEIADARPHVGPDIATADEARQSG